MSTRFINELLSGKTKNAGDLPLRDIHIPTLHWATARLRELLELKPTDSSMRAFQKRLKPGLDICIDTLNREAEILAHIWAGIEDDRRREYDLLSVAAQKRGVTHDDVTPGMRGSYMSRAVEVVTVDRRRDGRIDGVVVKFVDVESAKLVTCTRRKDGIFQLAGQRSKFGTWRLILGEWPTPRDDANGGGADAVLG